VNPLAQVRADAHRGEPCQAAGIAEAEGLKRTAQPLARLAQRLRAPRR